MKRRAFGFFAGVLFAAGLALAGMTGPARIIAFLDVTGAWDPSLLFVMVGAIGVHGAVLLATRARERPLLAPAFHEPSANAIDARLVSGAVVFGVGWGLSGFCPGPAIVSLGSGAVGVFVFFGALVAGTLIATWLLRAGRSGDADVPSTPVDQGAAASK